jgi:hypothetical protein
MRSVLAVAWQAVGSVHAMLAQTENGAERQQDRETARQYLERSQEEWRKLSPLEGFTEMHRKEMESTTTALVALPPLENSR